MADTAAERISESAAAPHAERKKDRWTALGNGVGLFRSGALGAARTRCHLILCILNGALSGLFRR